jgi:hypothetical protein
MPDRRRDRLVEVRGLAEVETQDALNQSPYWLLLWKAMNGGPPTR